MILGFTLDKFSVYSKNVKCMCFDKEAIRSKLKGEIKMNIAEQFAALGVVPVVVLNDVKDASHWQMLW